MTEERGLGPRAGAHTDRGLSYSDDLMGRAVYGLSSLLDWAYARPMAFPLIPDLLAWPAGLLVGAALKLVFRLPDARDELLVAMVCAVAIHAAAGVKSGLYGRRRWRASSFAEVSQLGGAWAVVTVPLVLGGLYARSQGSELPTSALISGCMVTLALHAASRFLWRRYWEISHRPDLDRCKSTIVFGAGEGGSQMIRAMFADPASDYYPVALLDDDPRKRHREIEGVRVLGTRYHIEEIAEETEAEVLLVAVSEADSELIAALSKEASFAGLELLVLPPSSELVGKMALSDARPPTVDDLLGRDPVEIDLESVAGYIHDKRVLVTGAGGSIGSELSKQIHAFSPKSLYLLDRDENALHGVQLELEGRALLDSEMLVVADIRDRDRIYQIFRDYKPEVVFHAAALKHLTLLENNPLEGVKTNVFGTRNVLDAAVAIGAEKFVNVSTDKAADPSSVLGATKLAAEKLTARAADATGRPYVSVRFGNVLGSAGSVLPTFLRQIEKNEPLTVTNPDASRYFMTIPEAVRLVVQAGAIGKPGEVMVLDMGNPVRIVDLAQQLIDTLSPATTIEFTGLRPGEKLHEILLSENEIGVSRDHPRILHTTVTLGDVSRELADLLHIDESELRNLLGSLRPLRLVDELREAQ